MTRGAALAGTAACAYAWPDPRTWGALPTLAGLVAQREAAIQARVEGSEGGQASSDG